MDKFVEYLKMVFDLGAFSLIGMGMWGIWLPSMVVVQAAGTVVLAMAFCGLFIVCAEQK